MMILMNEERLRSLATVWRSALAPGEHTDPGGHLTMRETCFLCADYLDAEIDRALEAEEKRMRIAIRKMHAVTRDPSAHTNNVAALLAQEQQKLEYHVKREPTVHKGERIHVGNLNGTVVDPTIDEDGRIGVCWDEAYVVDVPAGYAATKRAYRHRPGKEVVRALAVRLLRGEAAS